MIASSSALVNLLLRLEAWLYRCAERITAGRHWRSRLAIICVLLSVFVACPPFYQLGTGPLNEEWRAIIRQAEHPFVAHVYPESSHASKIAFRLTVPLIAHILRLDRTGLILFQGGCLFGLFFFLIGAANRVLTDRRDIGVLMFGLCCTFLGNVWVSDMRGIFDVTAFMLMACVMCVRSSGLRCAFLLAAYFTDERALIASPLLLLWTVPLESSDLDGRSVLRGILRQWIFPVSWVICLATREMLARECGLALGGGLIDLLFASQNNWALGMWTGLEGAWVLVLAGMVVLGSRREWAFATLLSLAIIAVIIVAWSVIDITRSMAYVFPAAFIALAILARYEPAMVVRRVLLVAFALCLFPTYYVHGDQYVLFYRSLPARLIMHVLS